MISTMKNRIFRALSPTGFRARAFVAIVVAGAIASACDVHGITAPGTVASITVTPNATLGVGATQQMTAVGYDADGKVTPISPTWSIAAGGGTVNATGLFTAGGVTGVFSNTVVASVGPISGSASITVIPGPLASISVVPNPVTLATGGTQQFVAVGKDAGGNIVPFTPTWSVVASGGAINSAGIFTAGAVAGTYANTVQASNGSLKAFATVTVTVGPLASITVTPNPKTLAAGGTQLFTAVGKDAVGNVIAIAPVWSVANGGGTIDNAGNFTAGGVPGTFANTVTATSGSISGNATVTVTVGLLATITVTPNPVNTVVNGVTQMTAVGRDLAGNIVPITPVWDVFTTPNGASITQTGLYTAGTVAGTFPNKIRATSNGISGFATVIVTSGALATITVTPNPVFMPTNSTQQFVAIGKDAQGNVFVITPVWSVVNGGGTINSSSGLFTSGAVAGSFPGTIQATSGGISGFASVDVAAGAPPPSPLGLAAPFGVLAGTGITCAISGAINGSASNIGSFPTLTVSGFPPCTFTGSIPLPAVVSAAKTDLNTAFVIMQTQACNTVLTGLDLGFYDGSTPAKSLPPGTYCFATSAGLTGTMKLTGSATAKWTFQIGSTLTSEVGSNVLLAGGAIPDNVYWVVGTSATFKTSSAFQGNVLARSSISLQNGSSLQGRALALDGAVDMTPGAVTITRP